MREIFGQNRGQNPGNSPPQDTKGSTRPSSRRTRPAKRPKTLKLMGRYPLGWPQLALLQIRLVLRIGGYKLENMWMGADPNGGRPNPGLSRYHLHPGKLFPTQ